MTIKPLIAKHTLLLQAATGSFGIDSSSAAITTSAVFDFESGTTSYGGTLATLGVQAVDGNGGTVQVPITINIVDINDPPVFASGSHIGNVNEEQSSGAAVTLTVAISVTDEENDTPAYSLIGRNVIYACYIQYKIPP